MEKNTGSRLIGVMTMRIYNPGLVRYLAERYDVVAHKDGDLFVAEIEERDK